MLWERLKHWFGIQYLGSFWRYFVLIDIKLHILWLWWPCLPQSIVNCSVSHVSIMGRVLFSILATINTDKSASHRLRKILVKIKHKTNLELGKDWWHFVSNEIQTVVYGQTLHLMWTSAIGTFPISKQCHVMSSVQLVQY